MKNEGLTEDIRVGFLVYLLCHKRPPHEILKPTFIDQRDVFSSEFEGMTNELFTYEQFESVKIHLVEKINLSLTDNEKYSYCHSLKINQIGIFFQFPMFKIYQQ